MPIDLHWITARISDAKKRHESVTEAVTVRMEKLLSGELSERSLSSAKLTSIAKELIADMTPTSLKKETKR
jgi:hypothetical protein